MGYLFCAIFNRFNQIVASSDLELRDSDITKVYQGFILILATLMMSRVSVIIRGLVSPAAGNR